jgi:hypothetical protein
MNNANQTQTQTQTQNPKFSVGKCYKIKGKFYDTYLGKYKESRIRGFMRDRQTTYFFDNSDIVAEKSPNTLNKIEEIPCNPQDNLVTTGGYIKKNKSKKNKSKKSSKKVKSKKQKSKNKA